MPHALLQQVLEFHQKFDCLIGDPRFPDTTVQRDLRLVLIKEEFNELKRALAADDTIEVADALGDMIYVLVGAAVAWGIDIASVLDEIHDSNMTKTPGNTREDGKVLKGPDFRPPDLKKVFERTRNDYEEQCVQENYVDAWWPKSTIPASDWINADPELAKAIDLLKQNAPEPPADLTERILAAAREIGPAHDFVPFEAEDFEAPEEPTRPYVPKALQGYVTDYGVFVFDCLCDRRLTVQATLGTRGGLAKDGKCECMCGKSYHIDFNTGGPAKVSVV